MAAFLRCRGKGAPRRIATEGLASGPSGLVVRLGLRTRVAIAFDRRLQTTALASEDWALIGPGKLGSSRLTDRNTTPVSEAISKLLRSGALGVEAADGLATSRPASMLR
ncbi:hypothetical protein CFHF_19590 [Caulobacter flavus]|uniref:Uncharacterized protein n=1 Tax=Caulobacter flavus TaxID=1679497 RepID=A0A2N5CNY4_9CAUL|nr:hypothetical protein C1707_21475 [Caulobacter flavus]PLR08663.1 hypothetical protein CFHF_19590 [Caulobacter flavus]